MFLAIYLNFVFFSLNLFSKQGQDNVGIEVYCPYVVLSTGGCKIENLKIKDENDPKNK